MATSNMKESHLSVDDLVLQAHHFARALQGACQPRKGKSNCVDAVVRSLYVCAPLFPLLDFQPSLSAEQLRDFEQLQSQYSSS